MLIDFQKEIKNIHGVTVKESDAPDAKPVTLGFVAIEALLIDDPQARVSGSDKMKRYRLAQEISKLKEALDITVEDVALIKDLIGKKFSANIVGPAYDLIDGGK